MDKFQAGSYRMISSPTGRDLKMYSKILRILAIAITTLFLGAQAFAGQCAKEDKDIGNKADQGTSSTMSDTGGSGQSLSPDRDTGKMNQGGYDNTKSQDLPQTDESGTGSGSDAEY